MAKVKTRDAKYWLDRAERRKLYFESLWPNAAKRIASEYQAVASEMKDKLAAFYGRFGVPDDNGNIIVGYGEAIKSMTTAEAVAFKNRITRAKAKYKGTPDRTFAQVLDQYGRNLALPRFMMLELDAQILAHDAAVMQAQITAQTLSANTLTAYYYTVNQIETALGVGLKYGAMNAKQVRDIVTKNWSGKEFSARIWADREALASSLKRTMLDGFIGRKRNEQMAKDIAERFDVSYSSAERLMRTESAHVVEQATLDGYKEAGIEEYEFTAVLDERTSEICSDPDLNGHVFPLKDAQEGVNYPPMHPNCRSTTRPVYDGEKIEVADAKRPYDSWEAWKKAEGSEKIDKVAREAVEPIVRIV